MLRGKGAHYRSKQGARSSSKASAGKDPPSIVTAARVRQRTACGWRRQCSSRGDCLLEGWARQLEGRLELRELGTPQTRGVREVRGSRIEQRADGAEAPKQLAREVDRALSLDAGTKQDREQLSVGERGGAESKQPLAGTFLNGPVCNGHGIRLKSRFAA